jgi:hypothetical protein
VDPDETIWQNNAWNQQLGYFKKIPELAAAVNAKATWTIGKGVICDPETQFVLDKFKGNGKDTFNTILENDVRVYHIGGDSYCHIVRDEDGNPINLKPLNPGRMRHVIAGNGMIKRFELLDTAGKNPIKKFEPEEIFYLPRNRVADECHGNSIIDQVEEIILMRNEAMADMKTLMHRHVVPIIKWQLDTDDPIKIAAFKIKADKATTNGENLFIPKGAVDADILAVPANATLNPLPWIDKLNSYFYEACMTPKIIVGNSSEITDASSKIGYLAWQQNIEEEQMFLEEQIGQQLGLKIELNFPASLQNDMLSQAAKNGPENIDQSEMGATPVAGVRA